MGVVWLRIVYVRRRLDIQSYHMHLNHLCRWVRLLLDRSLDPPRLLCLLFRVIMWVIIIHLGGWVCVKHPQRSCHSSGWQSLLSSSKDARHYHCSWQTSSTTCNPANSRIITLQLELFPVNPRSLRWEVESLFVIHLASLGAYIATSFVFFLYNCGLHWACDVTHVKHVKWVESIAVMPNPVMS